ncbi:holo-ACP synthase [Rhodococcus coprophilus]|uniref:Holo-[acyl-carrier-protein] synthase n=1 Tax=Rhodococcus coprophilus TaxID=38310 RepID=A0A2X4U6U1_9NOCA|nr:holo-ACP synthase [Rhodococcus coprophilus]MBM7459079.1 holo-[acyl-carrier protein] synthase [Rhodococcus coprophilus]SQI34701.1 holo-ACP synthase [Rhodococcus coprophilus]
MTVRRGNVATPRIGCDVVTVADVARSIDLFGDRYLRRIFTPHELSVCTGAARTQRLAARFAAKEAVMKVLRPRDEAIPWRSIEIRREPWGGCSVQLDGNAAARASDEQLTDFQVSLSHEPEYALATVAATRTAVTEREQA